MTTRLRVLFAQPDRNVPALTVALDADGTAQFTRGSEDPAAAAYIESVLRRGVMTVVASEGDPSALEPRTIEPTEGAAYLDAVADMLGRTSRWVVVPE